MRYTTNSNIQAFFFTRPDYKTIPLLPLFLLIIVSIAAWHNDVFAFNATLGINGGYDNNVNATPDESGSTFTTFHMNLNHQMSHDKAYGKSGIYLNSFYKYFSQFEDNLAANAGAYYSFFPGSDRFMTLGLIETGMYRDEEDKYDELNRIKTGVQLKYFHSGRTTFHLAQYFNWNRYLEPVEYAVLEQQSGSGSGNAGTSLLVLTKHRNDCYASTDLGINIKLHPMFTLTMYALYNKLYSNIETEAYDGFGSSVYCRFSPDPSWGISTEGFIWRNTYDGGFNRTDTYRSVNLLANLFIDRYELFLRADFMDNDSSFDDETYTRIITQCGISVFF